MAAGRMFGKVSVVTGASSGLGRAIALSYAREGSSLVCADLKPEAREEVPGEALSNTDELIRQGGGRSIFVKTDVRKEDEMKALIESTVAEYGRIDVMVNNAGVSLESRDPRRPKVHQTSVEMWDMTMAINLRSVFLGCKYAIRQMLKQEPHGSGDRGWIINMSSIFGLVGGYRNVSYAASKGAVANLTRTVALDYAESGIHCNALCPGYTETAIFVDTAKNMDSSEDIRGRRPFGGLGKPQDIAGAALFLASDDASWVTGVCLPVDGGYTAQ